MSELVKVGADLKGKEPDQTAHHRLAVLGLSFEWSCGRVRVSVRVSVLRVRVWMSDEKKNGQFPPLAPTMTRLPLDRKQRIQMQENTMRPYWLNIAVG